MTEESLNIALEAYAYGMANIAICITDENGVYISVNDKYASLFGYKPSELIGGHFLKVMPKDEADKVVKFYGEKIREANFEAEMNVTRVKKNGEILHAFTTYRVIEHEGKHYMISTVRDVTEQKELEEKRILKQQLLLQQSKMAALAEMISAIAHQWRQPLNALGLMIQDLKIANRFGELTDEYLEEFNNGAMAQINGMSKTIDDFRNFFKPDKDKEQFALISAILDVVALLKPQLEHLGIETNVYSPLDIDEPGEATIVGYPNEFKQLILNLISNSKDAIVEKHAVMGNLFGGSINVEIGIKKESGSRFAFVKIMDNGIGIDEKIMPRIFEPYFTTKEQGKGTGVGLYMAKMIIEQNMGGTITASNREGGGAVFEIRFEEGKGVFV